MMFYEFLLFNLLFTFSTSININIYNYCNQTINIYSHENQQFINKCLLKKNDNCIINYNKIEAGLIKTEPYENVTLFEFTHNDLGIWYDISVIPPGSGVCYSYNDCYNISKKIGYNIPMYIEVNTTLNNLRCINLSCDNQMCNDAYLYPFDDEKTHFCNNDTLFKISLCNLKNKNNLNNLNMTLMPELQENITDILETVHPNNNFNCNN